MPIVFESPKDRYGIGAAGSILGNALMQKNMERLQNTRQLESEGRQEIRQLSSEERQKAAQIEAEKRKIQQTKDFEQYRGTIVAESMEGLDLNTPEGQQQFYANLNKKGYDVNPLEFMKAQAAERVAGINAANKKPPKSLVNKEINKQVADTILTFPKLQSMGKTIDRIEQLIPEVSGPSGMFKGALGLGEATAEINALGLTLLEPVLKIFNPVGAIATRKMELLKDKIVPKATDTTEVIQGKLNFARKIHKDAMEKAQRISELYEEYGEDIPYDKLLAVTKEADIDKYIQGEGKNQQQSFDKLPNAKDYNGKRIEDEESGVIYESNGTNWKKVK
jgi:hypothetical protein